MIRLYCGCEKSSRGQLEGGLGAEGGLGGRSVSKIKLKLHKCPPGGLLPCRPFFRIPRIDRSDLPLRPDESTSILLSPHNFLLLASYLLLRYSTPEESLSLLILRRKHNHARSHKASIPFARSLISNVGGTSAQHSGRAHHGVLLIPFI